VKKEVKEVQEVEEVKERKNGLAAAGRELVFPLLPQFPLPP
jgi:hypothetical protein